MIFLIICSERFSQNRFNVFGTKHAEGFVNKMVVSYCYKTRLKLYLLTNYLTRLTINWVASFASSREIFRREWSNNGLSGNQEQRRLIVKVQSGTPREINHASGTALHTHAKTYLLTSQNTKQDHLSCFCIMFREISRLPDTSTIWPSWHHTPYTHTTTMLMIRASLVVC